MSVTVGLLDSGFDGAFAGRAFTLVDGEVVVAPVRPDRLGHGTAIGEIILAGAPQARLLDAQVFDARGITSAAAVAAGLTWLVDGGARIVNMSLGLTEDRAVLRHACAAALAADVLLVASVPAMGPLVFPARYPGIIRVTGDARCVGGAIAVLADGRADFGANPRTDQHSSPVAGASVAAARITAALAAAMEESPACGAQEALARLVATACHRGPQTEHLGGASA